MQRHHYVPQFYLREWYAPETKTFWLYCRDVDGSLRTGLKSAKSIGYCKGLYSAIPDGLTVRNEVSNEIEEKFFSPIDSAASQVHQKILSAGVSSLSTEERHNWSLFVNSLLERSPTRINEVKNSSKEMVAKTISDLRKVFGESEEKSNLHVLWKNLDIDALTHNTVLSSIVKWAEDEETIQYFSNMAWVVIQANGKDHFLTGDAPLVVNGVSGGYPIHFLSISLSPERLLVMHTRDEEFDEEFIRKLSICHSIQIAKQTKRYLVSSRELLDDGYVKYWRVANEIFSPES